MTLPRVTDRHVLAGPSGPLPRLSDAPLAAARRPLHLVADRAETRTADEMRTWRFQSFEVLLQYDRLLTAPPCNRVSLHGPSGRCFADDNASRLTETTPARRTFEMAFVDVTGFRCR